MLGRYSPADVLPFLLPRVLQGLGPPERADLSLRRWALPDLPAPAAMAAEGRGRQVMYQADFWIAWGLLLSESPNEFADHKENAVCLITELQSVPSPRLPPPPQSYSSPGIYRSFSI